MSRNNFSLKLLALVLGAFFIILGITDIFKEFGESIFSLAGGQYTLKVIFGVIEILCGLLLFIGFFLFYDPRPIFWGGLIILFAWTTRVILTKFVWGLNFINSGNVSIPGLISWLLVFLCDLIIMVAIISVIKKPE